MDRVVLAVTNDLIHDQRVLKVGNTLSSKYDILLVGRESTNSNNSVGTPFETHLIKCWINSGILFYLEFNIRLLFFLLNQRASIITANDLDTVIACRVASLVKRAKFVFDAHELFIDVPELLNHPIKRGIWRMVGKIFLKGSHNNYTVNDSLSSLLGSRYKVGFEVIKNYPFIGIKEGHKKSPAAVKDIVYQGALNEGRGIIEAIKALNYLPEFMLHIVGCGKLQSALIKTIDEHALTDRVVMHGSMTPESLHKFTPTMGVGLNLLDEKSKNYYYSSANKHYDYIKAGIPSVNMNFPEYVASNNIAKTSVLINNLDPKSIAEAIKSLYATKSLYSSLVENCQVAQKLFAWESQEQKLLDIYQSA